MPPTAVLCVVQIRGYLRQADDHGASVAAVWIQDWVGTVSTSSGHRPFWDWRWNQQRYPGEIGTQVRRNDETDTSETGSGNSDDIQVK